MKPIEIYDILTLEDDKDYVVANMAKYNNSKYLYLVEVDEEENVIETNQQIVRRVWCEGEESVEIVTDKEELEPVQKIFFELFKDMSEETISED